MERNDRETSSNYLVNPIRNIHVHIRRNEVMGPIELAQHKLDMGNADQIDADEIQFLIDTIHSLASSIAAAQEAYANAVLQIDSLERDLENALHDAGTLKLPGTED